jgi:hypothetical protein
MSTNGNGVEESKVNEIIQKLLSARQDDDLAYRTDSRHEYDLLFRAAQNGSFPDSLSITRKGVRLNKRLVHAPLSQTQHQ